MLEEEEGGGLGAAAQSNQQRFPLTIMKKVTPSVTALLCKEGRDAPFDRPRDCA